jgi:hypothetical protein
LGLQYTKTNVLIVFIREKPEAREPVLVALRGVLTSLAETNREGKKAE